MVTPDWLDLYPEALQLLPKPAFDHFPILLDSCYERWGPAPFRFEKMWLEESHFLDFIREWWKELRVEGWAGFRLAVKLKLLKGKIKEWVGLHFGEVVVIKDEILEQIILIVKEEKGPPDEFQILRS